MNGRAAGGARPADGPVAVPGYVSEFLGDVVTLGELQARLVALDLRETGRRAALPLTVAASAVVLAAGSVPVLLLGIAALLADGLGIRPGWAMALTAGASLALAGVATVAGWTRLRRTLDGLHPSREELRRNLAWIRSLLDGPHRRAPGRGL